MKKLYSKRLGKEAYALTPEQLSVFARSGYQTPKPEEVIADPAAHFITPPADKRAYVVFNFQTGAFSVRIKACTIKGEETPAFIGEVVRAAITKKLVENADPDAPKAAAGQFTDSPLAYALKEALTKAAAQKASPAPSADRVDASPEVTE